MSDNDGRGTALPPTLTPMWSTPEANPVVNVTVHVEPAPSQGEAPREPGVPSVEECEHIAYRRGREEGRREAFSAIRGEIAKWTNATHDMRAIEDVVDDVERALASRGDAGEKEGGK